MLWCNQESRPPRYLLLDNSPIQFPFPWMDAKPMMATKHNSISKSVFTSDQSKNWFSRIIISCALRNFFKLVRWRRKTRCKVATRSYLAPYAESECYFTYLSGVREFFKGFKHFRLCKLPVTMCCEIEKLHEACSTSWLESTSKLNFRSVLKVIWNATAVGNSFLLKKYLRDENLQGISELKGFVEGIYKIEHKSV